ncbi:ABI family, member 3a isoform 2-T5 [Pholidichthys leucotaenia]
MKDQNLTDEVMKILEEAPNARKALRENYDNLLNVADYCYNNYIQSGEGSMNALEETKKFTTQSLASVAYQISTLANSILGLLDAQTNQLRNMESSINLIGQTVEMHKEKVSRREIGVFTMVRRVPRNHKILPPTDAQPRPPYSRRTINYQQLDAVGHGMKVSGKQADRSGTIRKHGASIRSNKRPEPVQCPLAPPVGGSSFGKPVAPPSIPSTWQAPPENDIITTLLEDAPLPPPAENAMFPADISALPPPPPPPDLSGEMPAPAPPRPPPDLFGEMVTPPPPPPPPLSGALLNQSAPPPAPPITLETVVEENSSPSPCPPSPPPPPPSEHDSFPALPNDDSEVLAPPPPPPPCQELDDLEIPAPPPPLLLDSEVGFDDILPPLPPPVDYDVTAPPEYLKKDLDVPAPPPPLLLDLEVGFDDILPPLPPPVDYDVNAPPEYLKKVLMMIRFSSSSPPEP